jgi:hypothetical protein
VLGPPATALKSYLEDGKPLFSAVEHSGRRNSGLHRTTRLFWFHVSRRPAPRSNAKGRFRVVPCQRLHRGSRSRDNAVTRRNRPLFVDLETCCRGPVQFELTHVPERSASAIRALMKDCFASAGSYSRAGCGVGASIQATNFRTDSRQRECCSMPYATNTLAGARCRHASTGDSVAQLASPVRGLWSEISRGPTGSPKQRATGRRGQCGSSRSSVVATR